MYWTQSLHNASEVFEGREVFLSFDLSILRASGGAVKILNTIEYLKKNKTWKVTT